MATRTFLDLHLTQSQLGWSLAPSHYTRRLRKRNSAYLWMRFCLSGNKTMKKNNNNTPSVPWFLYRCFHYFPFTILEAAIYSSVFLLNCDFTVYYFCSSLYLLYIDITVYYFYCIVFFIYTIYNTLLMSYIICTIQYLYWN